MRGDKHHQFESTPVGVAASDWQIVSQLMSGSRARPPNKQDEEGGKKECWEISLICFFFDQ